jgi:hypothetical protein
MPRLPQRLVVADERVGAVRAFALHRVAGRRLAGERGP